MMPVKKTNHNNNHNYPMKLLSSPENGSWRMTTSGSGNITRQRLSVFKLPNNARRKRLQIRRLRWATYQTSDHRRLKKDHVDDSEGSNSREEGNEVSLSLSFSSSSDHSSENYDVSSGFDDEKKTSKDEERLTCVSHGLVSVIGRRREMEDAVRVEVGLAGKGGEKYDFFAVYDGHGGTRVAEACKERLHRVLMEMIVEDEKEGSEGGIGWERLMEGSFEKMDEEVNRGRLREDMVGSTAVVAVVGKEELVVANCGDSRAVLFRGGVAVPLSIDHKPDRPDELRRVESAGGRVINWNGYRILGVLATSRSIGDRYLKPFVISKPEVLVSERTGSDEFLILASDGLWDVVSNEVACQVVKRCFSGHIKWASSLEVLNENRATRAAAVLAELALARGSSDNISVIVVELNNPSSNFL